MKLVNFLRCLKLWYISLYQKLWYISLDLCYTCLGTQLNISTVNNGMFPVPSFAAYIAYEMLIIEGLGHRKSSRTKVIDHIYIYIYNAKEFKEEIGEKEKAK